MISITVAQLPVTTLAIMVNTNVTSIGNTSAILDEENSFFILHFTSSYVR